MTIARPWVCRYCGKWSPTESVNASHEPKCPMRVEDK